jgi:hypothetical protein
MDLYLKSSQHLTGETHWFLTTSKTDFPLPVHLVDAANKHIYNEGWCSTVVEEKSTGPAVATGFEDLIEAIATI